MISSLSEVTLLYERLNRNFIKDGFPFQLNAVSFGEQIVETPFLLHTKDPE